MRILRGRGFTPSLYTSFRNVFVKLTIATDVCSLCVSQMVGKEGNLLYLLKNQQNKIRFLGSGGADNYP